MSILMKITYKTIEKVDAEYLYFKFDLILFYFILS